VVVLPQIEKRGGVAVVVEVAEFINEGGLKGHAAFRTFQNLSEHPRDFPGGPEEYRCQQ